MPVVLVHGVPDTHRMWDALRAHLDRTDVVAVALPGFGTAVPPGFDASKEAYVDWLLAEIARMRAPVDLVGHDWGANLVQRVVSLRPDLVRTWAAGSGIVDIEYVWHDLARQWQTPGVGEQIMELMAGDAMAEALAAAGVPPDAAREAASRVDDAMKACILRLYRSALRVGAEWQPGVERVTRPALVFWGADDAFGDVRFAERLAARVRGELVVFPGTGHWWPVQRPAETAAALARFWAAARE
jgi:pimeloyl-ACP methyl ester carboxylesterase